MKYLATVTAVAFVVVALGAYPVISAPKPAAVPIRWQLEIDAQPIESIELKLPGSRAPELFWFIRYMVTNNTDRDVIFVPDFVLYTDTGQIIRAGQKVPTAAFKAIKSIYNEPLLKDMTDMTGKILQGADNAKEGVAIWRDFDPKAGGFDIFAGGLSGETAEVKLPKPIKIVETDAKGNRTTVTKDRIVLSKTLNLQYSIPGEAQARSYIKPALLKRQWVMR